MADKTTQSANDVVDYLLRGVAPSWAGATTLYLSLHTGAVGVGGNQLTNEADYVPYARIPLSRNSSGDFDAAAAMQSANNVLKQFAKCTGAGGGGLPQTITHAAIGENASGAGTVIATAALSSPLVVNTNIRPQFDVGTIVVGEQ